MKIKNVEFELAAAKAVQAAHNKLPHVAIAGRSNVGKSSFINAICDRRGLARTSRTPGRTREIVMFRVNDAWYLSDLPGYGYAKVPRPIRDEWGREIDAYLSASENLRGVVLLFDSRRDLRPDDFDLLHWLAVKGRPVVAAITKMDKFPKNQAKGRIDYWTRALEGLVSAPPVAFSSVARTGRDQALSLLERCLAGELEPAQASRFREFAG